MRDLVFVRELGESRYPAVVSGRCRGAIRDRDHANSRNLALVVSEYGRKVLEPDVAKAGSKIPKGEHVPSLELITSADLLHSYPDDYARIHRRALESDRYICGMVS